MNTRRVMWVLLLLSYLSFTFWYTNTRGPLTAEEVQLFTQRAIDAGFESAEVDRLQSFMSTDTGRQFLMINNIDLAENPPDVAGAEGESAPELMGRYMEFMYPALLRRACHPIYAGRVVFDAMDVVGIENAETWDQGALMRYRSRRDLLEIVTNPAFQGRHDFKDAALTKTIAYPVENMLYFSDPRLLLAMLFLIIGLLADKFFMPRSRAWN